MERAKRRTDNERIKQDIESVTAYIQHIVDHFSDYTDVLAVLADELQFLFDTPWVDVEASDGKISTVYSTVRDPLREESLPTSWRDKAGVGRVDEMKVSSEGKSVSLSKSLSIVKQPVKISFSRHDLDRDNTRSALLQGLRFRYIVSPNAPLSFLRSIIIYGREDRQEPFECFSDDGAWGELETHLFVRLFEAFQQVPVQYASRAAPPIISAASIPDFVRSLQTGIKGQLLSSTNALQDIAENVTHPFFFQCFIRHELVDGSSQRLTEHNDKPITLQLWIPRQPQNEIRDQREVLRESIEGIQNHLRGQGSGLSEDVVQILQDQEVRRLANQITVSGGLFNFLERYRWDYQRSFTAYVAHTQCAAFIPNWQKEPITQGKYLPEGDEDTERNLITAILRTAQHLGGEFPDTMIMVPLTIGSYPIGALQINLSLSDTNKHKPGILQQLNRIVRTMGAYSLSLVNQVSKKEAESLYDKERVSFSALLGHTIPKFIFKPSEYYIQKMATDTRIPHEVRADYAALRLLNSKGQTELRWFLDFHILEESDRSSGLPGSCKVGALAEEVEKIFQHVKELTVVGHLDYTDAARDGRKLRDRVLANITLEVQTVKNSAVGIVGSLESHLIAFWNIIDNALNSFDFSSSFEYPDTRFRIKLEGTALDDLFRLRASNNGICMKPEIETRLRALLEAARSDAPDVVKIGAEQQPASAVMKGLQQAQNKENPCMGLYRTARFLHNLSHAHPGYIEFAREAEETVFDLYIPKSL